LHERDEGRLVTDLLGRELVREDLAGVRVDRQVQSQPPAADLRLVPPFLAQLFSRFDDFEGIGVRGGDPNIATVRTSEVRVPRV